MVKYILVRSVGVFKITNHWQVNTYIIIIHIRFQSHKVINLSSSFRLLWQICWGIFRLHINYQYYLRCININCYNLQLYVLYILYVCQIVRVVFVSVSVRFGFDGARTLRYRGHWCTASNYVHLSGDVLKRPVLQWSRTLRYLSKLSSLVSLILERGRDTWLTRATPVIWHMLCCVDGQASMDIGYHRCTLTCFRGCPHKARECA